MIGLVVKKFTDSIGITSSLNEKKNENLEMFSLVWLDSNPHEGRNTEQKLRSIVNQLNEFQDVNLCQDFIKNTSEQDRLILIVSGRLGREILPQIHSIRQLISIYIYCLNKQANEQWSSKYSKVKGVLINLDDLISKISQDHRIEMKIEEPLSINIFACGGQSTSELNGKFVFFQVLIECLLRLKSNEKDKKELVEILKQQYEGNENELDFIDTFEKNYRSNEILKWYSKECFFYKTLNSVLRTENIHLIFLYRSFIFDLQQELQKYQSNEILKVYRAQIISKTELNNLKKSINQFISINSFFSTTSNYLRALSFFDLAKSTENTEKILFTIEANPTHVKTKPFANISQFSNFPDEEEVLFMIGSTFKLEQISFDEKNQFSIIKITLSSDDDNQLKQVLTYMKEQIGKEETNLRIFAKILSETGQFQLAEKYLMRMLEQISSPNDPQHADLYEDLAKVTSQAKRLDESMIWRQKLIDFKEKYPTNSSDQSKLRPYNTTGVIVAGHGGYGAGLHALAHPSSLCVDDNQIVYVVEWSNHRVVAWKYGATSGQVVAGGNGPGNQLNQLNCPTDVIVDEKRRSLIICDRGNRRVVRWPLSNGKTGEILIINITCNGLSMDNCDFLYVSDTNRNCVSRWKIGEMREEIVAGGNGRGDSLKQLNDPYYIFVDRNYSIYISDNKNQRVIKWNKDAKEGVVVAGGRGAGNTLQQLSDPLGVVVDQFGAVYVADAGNARIMKWPKNATKGCIIIGDHNKGKEINQLNRPNGLSFDLNGNPFLYIVEENNHRVQRFDIN